MAANTEAGTTLRDYLNVAKRRKWVILQAVVLVPAAATAFSLTQTKLYEATAEVLLSRQNLAAALTGTPDATLGVQADRLAQTQASLARVPDVARRVLEQTNSDLTPKEFLDASRVSAKPNADLLDITVTDADPVQAKRLASAYAEAFTDYRRELDTRALTRARLDVEAKLDDLAAEGDRMSELYQSLVDKQQQLSTLEALQTSNAFPVRRAEEVEQVQPKPLRNGILGFALGLVLGIGLAFLWEALDTRVRTAEDIAERLGLTFLGRASEPPKKLRKQDRLVMLTDPSGTFAEAFRMLRTNLDFARMDRHEVKTIMVTSSVEQEGKSTTVANLAVALARSGQRVILVDLDLRRPYLDRFFGLYGLPGVTQVALGRAALTDALAPISIPGAEFRRNRPGSLRMPIDGNGNGGPETGSLRVLTSGPIPPAPGEFVATQKLESVLDELRNDADVVLVDAPPILRVGDAMTLSARVDAILVVARINVVRRHMLDELKRLLDTTRATKLGFVLTGAGHEEGAGYGYGYGYGSSGASAYAPVDQQERLTELA